MIDIVVLDHGENGKPDGRMTSPHKVWRMLSDAGSPSIRSVVVIDAHTGLSATFRDDGVTR